MSNLPDYRKRTRLMLCSCNSCNKLQRSSRQPQEHVRCFACYVELVDALVSSSCGCAPCCLCFLDTSLQQAEQKALPSLMSDPILSANVCSCCLCAPQHCALPAGAGDLFAAGFLYGLMRQMPLQRCAQIGCLAGGAVVQSVGAELSPSNWRWLFSRCRLSSRPCKGT